jgi:hypothetical protein
MYNGLSKPKGFLYRLLIDYAEAFDEFDRGNLMCKLESVLGKLDPVAALARDILDHNYFSVNGSQT